MSRFSMRTSRTFLQEVILPREAALLVPEALRHVAKQVFADEHDERHHLRDASTAFTQALASSDARNVTVSLSEPEIEHAPEALRHVARQVFRHEPQEDLLNAASEAIRALAPSSSPRR